MGMKSAESHEDRVLQRWGTLNLTNSLTYSLTQRFILNKNIRKKLFIALSVEYPMKQFVFNCHLNTAVSVS